ncbi:MAG: hypothetical protein ACFFD9_06230 [Candidatus Thorarchaeota archaeon]
MGLVTKIVGAVTAGAGAVVVFYGISDPQLSWIYYFIGLIVMSIGFSLFSAGGRGAEERKPPPPTVTEIRCDNPECTFKEIRDFQKGDYILKPIDVPCPKCQSSMTIHGVYVVREEPDEKYAI